MKRQSWSANCNLWIANSNPVEKLKSRVCNMFKNKKRHWKDLKWNCSTVFFGNFEYISQIVLMFKCRLGTVKWQLGSLSIRIYGSSHWELFLENSCSLLSALKLSVKNSKEYDGKTFSLYFIVSNENIFTCHVTVVCISSYNCVTILTS